VGDDPVRKLSSLIILVELSAVFHEPSVNLLVELLAFFTNMVLVHIQAFPNVEGRLINLLYFFNCLLLFDVSKLKIQLV
jgi:hypothetical protein